jgi:hypothetical protein
MRLDAGSGPVHVALRGSNRDSRQPCDVRVGKAEGVPQNDGGPLLGGEPGERIGNVTAQIGEGHERGRVRCLVDGLLLEQEWLRAPHALESHPITACIDHEPVEPRRELCFSAKLAEPGAELDEGLLRCVAGFLEILEQLRGEPVDARSMARHEDVERLPVATRCLAHELHVAQPLIESPGVPISLVQTGLGFDRLHAGVSVIK